MRYADTELLGSLTPRGSRRRTGGGLGLHVAPFWLGKPWPSGPGRTGGESPMWESRATGVACPACSPGFLCPAHCDGWAAGAVAGHAPPQAIDRGIDCDIEAADSRHISTQQTRQLVAVRTQKLSQERQTPENSNVGGR